MIGLESLGSLEGLEGVELMGPPTEALAKEGLFVGAYGKTEIGTLPTEDCILPTYLPTYLPLPTVDCILPTYLA